MGNLAISGVLWQVDQTVKVIKCQGFLLHFKVSYFRHAIEFSFVSYMKDI